MHKRALAVLSFALLLALTYAYSQSSAPSQAERFRQMSIDAETRGLAEPFKGITTNGTAQPDLFPIRSTGVSTEPVRKAAAVFLAALEPGQRKKTVFPVEDVEWRKMAELKAELEKLPADRQEQLRRELEDEGARKQ